MNWISNKYFLFDILLLIIDCVWWFVHWIRCSIIQYSSIWLISLIHWPKSRSSISNKCRSRVEGPFSMVCYYHLTFFSSLFYLRCYSFVILLQFCDIHKQLHSVVIFYAFSINLFLLQVLKSSDQSNSNRNINSIQSINRVLWYKVKR